MFSKRFFDRCSTSFFSLRTDIRLIGRRSIFLQRQTLYVSADVIHGHESQAVVHQKDHSTQEENHRAAAQAQN